ncbi:nitroreductase family deazaflavin-dependent oxidoreductase [Actinomadura nitritigenes]|uniref:nitroreductase family deazaflavin-dependent oxidoreductase n=1 Tax=Actinomadura nitritigenes TaxID=134602 RepID=UPI003D8D7854
MPAYEPSAFPDVRDQVALYEATDGREGGTLEGRPVIILTSLGVRTGSLRKTPLMRIEHEGAYIVVASYGGAPQHPDWYHNLVAEPRVTIQDGPEVKEMTARETTGAEKDRLWRLAEAAWPHFPAYRATAGPREIPLLILEPRLSPSGFPGHSHR